MKLTGQMLGIARQMVRSRSEYLRRYSLELEALLSSEADKLDAELRRQAAGLPEEQRDEFLADNSEPLMAYAGHFPNQLRYGLICSAYAFLEDEVMSIARYVRRARNLELHPTEVSGRNNFYRAVKYLEKVCRMRLPDEHLEKLQAFIAIRHSVAHAGGRVFTRGERDRELRRIIARTDHVYLAPHGELRVSREFIETSLGVIDEFLNDVLNAWADQEKIQIVESGNS